MKRFPGITASIFILSLVFLSCNKEGSRHCWTIVDNLGNDLNQVCNKTESEMLECVNSKTCGVNVPFTIGSCNYYMEDAPKHCYIINGNYQENVNESFLALEQRCFGSLSVQQVECGYCKKWFVREQRTYKPTSHITYSPVSNTQFCGDTVSTIYQGRHVIRKDDADSLIVIQFSNNGRDW